jgi:hypothetical protein
MHGSVTLSKHDGCHPKYKYPYHVLGDTLLVQKESKIVPPWKYSRASPAMEGSIHLIVGSLLSFERDFKNIE